MQRRGFIALAATIPFAGCGMLGGSDDGVSASLTADSDQPADVFSEPFEAEAGDEFEITIEAESDGASIWLAPSEYEVSSDDLMEDDDETIDWLWEVGPDEEISETIEIEVSDEYTFSAWEGAADVEASQA